MIIDFLGTPTKIDLVTGKYATNGRIAIQAVCDEEPFGFLTVNVPEVDLAEDEVIIKVWSENASWVPQVLAQLPGLVPTGKSIQTGFVTAPVYKVTG